MDKNDFPLDIKSLRKKAEQGDAGAQYSLGECYYGGEGVTQDKTEAARWYRLAADQGYAKAKFALGICYELGNGVPQDDAEAARWVRMAAEQGNAEAQDILGLWYSDGSCGVSQNLTEAALWYRKADDQGFRIAQKHLGFCYKDGKGVPQNYFEAVLWFRKAALGGDKIAQRALEECLDECSRDKSESPVRSNLVSFGQERILQVGDSLRKLIEQFGDEVISEPKKLNGLISDFIQERGVANTLKSAVEEGIPQALATLPPGIPLQASAGGLISRLQTDRGLGEDAARFAVLSWALALQVVDEAGLDYFFRTR